MAVARPAMAIALRNILVATDFSPCSERAVEHALAVARHYGSTLHFAHVVSPLAYEMTCPDGYANSADALRESTDLARRDVEQLARRGMERYGIAMLDHKVWASQGDVWEMLHLLVMQEDIDLVVLGTHGRCGLKKLFLGSVAEQVFRHCRCPVLTVGPHAPESPPAALRIRHVLFPTDLSPESMGALPFALSPLQESGAALTVLHIAGASRRDAASDRPREWREIERRMRSLVGREASLAGVEFEIESGAVSETILRYAEQRRSGLIVFGLKAPDTYVERLPWMEAYRVACEAPCPVLTVRAPSAWD